MEYADYLRSPQWKVVSEERRKIDGYKCVCCGGTGNLNVHHIHYPSNWADTEISMLRTLCKECHLTVHRIQEAYDKFKPHLTIRNSGYIDREKSGAFNILTREIMRIFVVQCWKRNLFRLDEVRLYVRGIESIASGMDGKRISKFQTDIGHLMAWIALVKDCFISNQNPDFDAKKREEHRQRKTRFK